MAMEACNRAKIILARKWRVKRGLLSSINRTKKDWSTTYPNLSYLLSLPLTFSGLIQSFRAITNQDLLNRRLIRSRWGRANLTMKKEKSLDGPLQIKWSLLGNHRLKNIKNSRNMKALIICFSVFLKWGSIQTQSWGNPRWTGGKMSIVLRNFANPWQRSIENIWAISTLFHLTWEDRSWDSFACRPKSTHQKILTTIWNQWGSFLV